MSTDVIELEAETSAPAEPSKATRYALWVFVAAAVATFVLCIVTSRGAWFNVDDWDFLAQRGVSVHDIFVPHGGHLVALPMLVYRFIFAIFGMHSYVPYQIPVIAAHLAVASMLRALMRREGVDPWIATAAASAILVFGSGLQDITVAFQITFTGSVAFGLAQLLLADHKGGLARRDWFALAAGLCALCCSGVGLAMVGVVGVVTLLRRGWRMALLQVAPLLVIFEIWLHIDETTNNLTSKKPKVLARWTWRGLEATFQSLTKVPFVGWLLAAMLIVGLVLAFLSWPASERIFRAAVPVAFVAGAIGFLVFTGYGRAWSGIKNAETSRYLYVYAVLFIVPIAIAADALVRRRRVLLAPVLVLLLIGVPANVTKLTDHVYTSPASRQLRSALSEIPRMPLAKRVPAGTKIDPNALPGVTVGWLLSGVRDGWLPSPSGTPSRLAVATNTLRLTLSETLGGSGAPCPALDGATDVNVDRGGTLRVHGTVSVQLVTDAGSSAFILFGNVFGAGLGDHTLHADFQPLHLRVVPRSNGAGAC